MEREISEKVEETRHEETRHQREGYRAQRECEERARGQNLIAGQPAAGATRAPAANRGKSPASPFAERQNKTSMTLCMHESTLVTLCRDVINYSMCA